VNIAGKRLIIEGPNIIKASGFVQFLPQLILLARTNEVIFAHFSAGNPE